MSAAVSRPTCDEGEAEAIALYVLAERETAAQLRRLTRLEGGLVRLLDLIDDTRDRVARGQALQCAALRLRGALRRHR